MSGMHPDTIAALRARLAAEIATDPTDRGYWGKTAAEIAALLEQPVPAPAPSPIPRVFAWSEARAIAQTHGLWPLIVVRARGTPSIPPATTNDVATLAAINAVSMDPAQMIDPSDPAAWAAFQAGLSAFLAVGCLTEGAAAAILALGSVVPASGPDGPARWQIVIDGLSAEVGHSGPPNSADAALVEALTNGG